MSEYLTYTLWRQREERMHHELERQRVVQERLNEKAQRLREEEILDVSTEREIGESHGPTGTVEDTETVGEPEPEFANR